MMSFIDVATQLLEKNVVTCVAAAHRTATVYVMHCNGHLIDSQIHDNRIHAQRLRMIGIDILKPFDISAGGSK